MNDILLSNPDFEKGTLKINPQQITPQPIVKLSNVNKNFKTKHGNFAALKNISLEVFPGEVVTLIGPSGSGKSTCLRAINALEFISGGQIEVCGIRYGEVKNSNIISQWFKQRALTLQIRRNTAMIFQRFELFPHLTALQNVAIGPRYVHRLSAAEAFQKAETLLQKVGLQNHASKFPRALSGGQQQRVAIARALAVEPRVLLCDEPTSALDPELVGEVTDVLRDIALSGVTMLVVTHEMSFAAQVSQRCVFFDAGEIVEQGLTPSLFANPQSQRLQQFLQRVGSNHF